jgi:multidrug efflux system membrane fusion protein
VPELERRISAAAPLPVTALDRTRSVVLDMGKFLSLNNQVDTQTGTVRAKARFDNAKHSLFPNQFVNVRVLLDTVHDAVVVPVTALRHGPEGDFVYVLDADRTVSVRRVVAGRSTVDSIAIASGLALGERVVTEGGDRLKEGARVTLPTDRPASAAGSRIGGASGARDGESRPFGAGGALSSADGASRPPRRRAGDAPS